MNICTTTLTVASFNIVKSGNNPCSHLGMPEETKHLSKGILVTFRKKRNSDTHYNMNKPLKHYFK